ncbi:serine protein kinase RIO [archaeon]|nr:serine protein kinase RIO [archaeon]
MELKQKEQRKIFKDVFDKSTIDAIWKLIRKKELDGLDYLISTGKEANVFRVLLKEKPRACKIYRYETTSFPNMGEYIQGDPRFEIRKNRRDLIKAWCKKEFKNLELARNAGCRVPRPYAAHSNVLIMQFIGDKEAAPTLKETILDDYKSAFWMIANDLKKMYQAGLIHADLSEYNVLIWKGETWIIDMGQSVLLSHPKAKEFLKRDIKNMIKYFKEHGIKYTEKELHKHITT